MILDQLVNIYYLTFNVDRLVKNIRERKWERQILSDRPSSWASFLPWPYILDLKFWLRPAIPMRG